MGDRLRLTAADVLNAKPGRTLYDGAGLECTRLASGSLQWVYRYTSPVSGKRRETSRSGITLKAARAGVITGVLLALARIAGETAPLLFTALSNQFWTSNLGAPMASLPVTIFKFAMSPYENWQKLAWACVFLITIGVLALNILSRVLIRNKH